MTGPLRGFQSLPTRNFAPLSLQRMELLAGTERELEGSHPTLPAREAQGGAERLGRGRLHWLWVRQGCFTWVLNLTQIKCCF